MTNSYPEPRFSAKFIGFFFRTLIRRFGAGACEETDEVRAADHGIAGGPCQAVRGILGHDETVPTQALRSRSPAGRHRALEHNHRMMAEVSLDPYHARPMVSSRIPILSHMMDATLSETIPSTLHHYPK